MATTRLVGVFDDRNSAQQVQQELIRAGIAENNIRLVAGQSTTSTATSSGRSGGDEGWWESIKDFFGFSDEQDTHYYREAARRGSTLVTVTADDAQADRAIQIMQRYGVVDLDERARQWQSEGWQGYQAGASTRQQTTTTAAATTQQHRAGATDETAIPVVEEELRIGKRAVQRGGVRIHSHVTERPVEEQVSLREEHVRVERRPVNRPVQNADAAFQERTIEATETAEQAVVSKQARVVEEVVVDKEATERTETVRDTVRRTDVEVEKTDPDQAGRRSSSSNTRNNA